MATPNRLKNSSKKGNRIKSALRPLVRLARVITPTGIGVLLSVGAHAALITAGPRLSISFDELTKENLAANPEETVVPILQLSAAERNRLPSFAQPRRPPASTGLSSLQLPSGLPSFPSNRSIKRRPVPAQPIPSPSVRKPKPIGQAFQNVPTQRTPIKLDIPFSLPAPAPSTPSGTVFIPPAPTTPPPNINSGAGARPIRPGDPLPELEPADLPNAESANSTNPGTEPSNSGSLSEALAGIQGVGIEGTNTQGSGTQESGTQGENIAVNSTEDPTNRNGAENSEATNAPNEEPLEVINEPEQIAMAEIGDESDLLNGYAYNGTGVSDAEAEENLNDWRSRSAEGKNQVDTQQAEITIDSGFKACRDVPPNNGIVGVVVNPDGTRESAEIIQSTGYGTVNRSALSAVESKEFTPQGVPTQYTVDIQVTYEPQNCASDLPSAPAE